MDKVYVIQEWSAFSDQPELLYAYRSEDDADARCLELNGCEDPDTGMGSRFFEVAELELR